MEGPARGAVVLFHRGHEHSGRVAHLADELNLPGYDIFAWDARGHGNSPGERGYSPSLADSVRDIQTFTTHIAEVHGIPPERTAVIAQSVGAVLAATWVHDYAPPIRALVLASPAFKVKLYVPFARPGLKLMQRLRGKFFVNSYVKARFLTHDPARIASYDSDPLITRAIAVNILLDLYETAERIVADAAAITVPTQLLISGADWVVHRGPQDRFYERLGSRTKERIVLDGFYHDTLGERDRKLAVDAARRFILREFDTPSAPRSLLDADQIGPFREESDRLASRGRARRLVLARGADQPEAGRDAVGWGAAGPPDRLRFGLDARLRLPQHAVGPRHARPAGRPAVPGRDRLARHPPAQGARRGVDSRRPCGGCGRPACRCAWSISPPGTGATCLRPWARWMAARPRSSRSCCATTAR